MSNIKQTSKTFLKELKYIKENVQKVATTEDVDTSTIEDFYIKTEVLHVSGNIYDLDFNNKTIVLCYENNSELAYYKGEIYKKYLDFRRTTSGHIDTRYICPNSGQCSAELRLRQDTSKTIFLLRFEHHTCVYDTLNKDIDNGITVKQTDVNKFYEKINEEGDNSKPLLHCDGYLYVYNSNTNEESANDLEYVGQHYKYKCHSLQNECPAQLLFRDINGARKVFQSGEHSCQNIPVASYTSKHISKSESQIETEDPSINLPSTYSIPEHIIDEVSSELETTKSLAYIVDPETQMKVAVWIDMRPVKVINLGRIHLKLRNIDPNDSTTVYKYIDDIGRSTKVIHYMGIDYVRSYRTRCRISYRCRMLKSCMAELKLSNDCKVALIGQHTCTPDVIDLKADSIESCYKECTLDYGFKEDSKDNSLIPSDKSVVPTVSGINNFDGKSSDSTNQVNLNTCFKSSVEVKQEKESTAFLGTEISGIDCSGTADSDLEATIKIKQEKELGDEIASEINNFNDNLNDTMNGCAFIKQEEDVNTAIEYSQNNDTTNISCTTNIVDGDANIKKLLDVTQDTDATDNEIRLSKNLVSIYTSSPLFNKADDLVIHYGKNLSKIVAFKGYEYVKEGYGKYGRCKKSKICPGKLKIFPDDKGEVISEHTCDELYSTRGKDPNDINSSNDNSVPVRIKTILDIPIDVKGVPLEEQLDYQMVKCGAQIEFKGYTLKKYYANRDIRKFACIHKNSSECPGIVEMQRYKVVRYREHLCKEIGNIRSDITQQGSTVLLYLNKITSEPEASYKHYTYRRISMINQISKWQCTASKKFNCTAGLELYTHNSTVSEIGRHVCNHEVQSDQTDPKKEDNPLLNKKCIKNRAFKNATLPGFANKSIIPVYNEQDELNLIYQGYVYQGEGENWTCIKFKSRACKGSLRLLNGNVIHVSKHDCFKDKTKNNSSPTTTSHLKKNNGNVDKDKHMFKGGERGDFAMYHGYIYKKMFTVRKEGIFKWNCIEHISSKCQGILTTKNNRVLTASQHICQNGYKDEIKASGRKVDGADPNSSFSTTSNRKDQKLISETVSQKIKRSSDDPASITETIPTKKIKRTRKDQTGTLTTEHIEENGEGDTDESFNLPTNEVNDDVAVIDENLRHENVKPLEVASEKEDSECFIILPMKEDIQHADLTCENKDFTTIISVKEESIKQNSDNENIPMMLSRGPNGEYFVHLGEMSDTKIEKDQL